MPHESSPLGVVTVSIGYAVTGSDNTINTPKNMVKCADTALYDAKAAGRNCVRG